ncbi:hypothetical protein SAMN02745146_1498 [Hymenobacter daecheongensis DSM 21074]|uniref:Uncharacterized protein n=1 Tax=Hymenobacter daecheongensis DSM 21074 TaxID=1121955 RepID=A0A1M6DGG2_9BACT|nr:hypothetical protein [Hymenobacter daecheongensis]SHI72203.1 hypothetical protein SAMN02745146_1498 [Hymenobacter daecheongensis DSM 21074]
MPRKLHPVSQKIVGWLFLTAGVLLLLGLALQVVVAYYRWQQTGQTGLGGQQLVLGLAMLAAAGIMVRMGWRMRTDQDR